MKCLLILILLIGVNCAQQYTTKYDNIDVDKILSSDRLLRNYVYCVLDKGKCSPDGEELKSHIQDALSTSCEKCSEKQKEVIKKVISHLMKNKRDWWNEIEAKYDPNGTYKAKYAEELKAEGIVI